MKMYKKNTGELENKLKKVHPDNIADFLSENQEEIFSEDREFMKYMKVKLKEKKLLKQVVLLNADISLRYGYKLLSEEKHTKQRDVILRICFAAEFTLEEVQRALKIYHMDTLYARDPRDAMIMACFNQRPESVIKLNELLVKNNMLPLRPSGTIE